MSEDDKKRDRAQQRRVRERMAKTGESYQAAWRQLTGDEAPAEEPTPEPAQEDSVTEPDSANRDVSWPPDAETRRKILGKSLTLDEMQKLVEARGKVTVSPRITEPDQPIEAPGPTLASRSMLPLHHPRVPPHQPTRVTGRPKNGAIEIDRVVISSAGTAGGAADWIVNDIEVDGRSQLAVKDLSGALFGPRGVAANWKASTGLSIHGFDTVEYDGELAIVVTYVGSNPEGIPFFGSAIGVEPPQRPTVIPISSSVELHPASVAIEQPLMLTKTTTIVARVPNIPFKMIRLEVDDDGTAGGAADWIVNDLRVNGRTQFRQPGAIPGDMFSTRAIDSFITYETCDAGCTIEIDVSYIGLNEQGARFVARLEGTVVRDDYSVAPPDLHVVVETIGHGPGKVVIARCNWRSPPPPPSSSVA